MSDRIAPVVELPEVSDPTRVREIGGCEGERNSEPFEILSNVLKRRISSVEREFSTELGLHGRP
jgi:hypothetical protein